LARSLSLGYKSNTKWTARPIENAKMLFKGYSTLEKACQLAQGLTDTFEQNRYKAVASLQLAHWYPKVEKAPFNS